MEQSMTEQAPETTPQTANPTPPAAPATPEPQAVAAPKAPPKSAGWTRGVSRKQSIYVQHEFKNAVKAMAAALNISSGVLTERALLAYMEAQPNGVGSTALTAVADVRCHSEEHRDNG
jgi:hypothetical protein